MKPVIEFLHFCPQSGKVIFGNRSLAQGLQILFHGFDSLQMGRDLLTTMRWRWFKDSGHQP